MTGSILIDSGQTFSGLTVSLSGTGSSVYHFEQSSTTYATDGDQLIWLSQRESGAVRFTFSVSVLAFGVDVIDLGTSGANSLTALDSNGSSATLVSGHTGSTANVLFRGYSSSSTFSWIELSGGVAGDVVMFDRVQYAPVPEPTTLALVGLGFAGMAWKGASTPNISSEFATVRVALVTPQGWAIVGYVVLGLSLPLALWFVRGVLKGRARLRSARIAPSISAASGATSTIPSA